MGYHVNLNDEPTYQLGVISGKIDLVLVQLAAHQRAVDARFDRVDAHQTTQDDAHAALSEEVAGLKRDRSWVLGAAAAVSAAIAAAGTFLMGR